MNLKNLTNPFFEVAISNSYCKSMILIRDYDKQDLMTMKKDIVKDWKVLSAAFFLTALLVVGPAGFQSLLPSIEQAIAQEPTDEQVVPTSTTQPIPGTSNSAPSTQVSVLQPNLKLFKTFTNAEFVQAGVGLRDVGSGTISVHTPTGINSAATLTAAYLYWAILDTGTSLKPTHSQIATISFNGQMLNGTRIGTDVSPCWGTNNIYIYRAIVTSNLNVRGGQLDDQYVSVTSNQQGGASPWDVLPVAIPAAESAHLVVVYHNAATTSTVQIFDPLGAISGLTDTIGTVNSFTVPLPAYVAGKQAAVGYAVADGQHFSGTPLTKSVTWSTPTKAATTLLSGEAFGNDPALATKASLRGSLSDTPQFDISGHGLISAGDTSGTLALNFAGDCLTTVEITVED